MKIVVDMKVEVLATSINIAKLFLKGSWRCHNY